ncbi:MAG: alpha/beta hydrolase-fold protein [Fuerstiella sp.]|nr:alpha/beta hydrolase-fold protein [Fuerstiella sp.]
MQIGRVIQIFRISLILTGLIMPDAVAQQIRSPEVHKDGTVTLRLRSNAGRIVIADIAGRKLQMAKEDQGIWSVTTGKLHAGIHDYSFDVDGTRMIDPSNRNVKKWFSLTSMVEVPGNPPLVTEFQHVPHGVVQRLIYPSNSVGHSRPVMVYTPPDYDAAAKDTYPLVVLLHGFGDDETAWTEVGRAHLIADNMIAAKDVRKCVIAMPYGHPIPPPYHDRPDDYFPDNADLYELDIITDLLPFLEKQFRLETDVTNRSIVGLSMGGGHAIDTGLKNVDVFSAIGAFSAAAPELETTRLRNKYVSLTGPEPAANKLRHFWIPIGDEDFLLERNDSFVTQLTAAGVVHEYVKTPGGHEWKLWRKYFEQFLQMTVPAD